jgi:protein TonB
MLSSRQTFFISLGLHVFLIAVLLASGVFLYGRLTRKPEPIELDLLAPATVAQEEQGTETTQQPDKSPEEAPKIIERDVDTPTFDPTKTVDLSKMPKVEQERFKPYKPAIEAKGASGQPGSPEGSYIGLLVAQCKRNWEKTKPSRGILGSEPPRVEVRITVRRDGHILGHTITRHSGIPAVDRSVEEAITLCNPFPAFPPELEGAQRDFEIAFRLEL